jgi:hypothetical protein
MQVFIEKTKPWQNKQKQQLVLQDWPRLKRSDQTYTQKRKILEAKNRETIVKLIEDKEDNKKGAISPFFNVVLRIFFLHLS